MALTQEIKDGKLVNETSDLLKRVKEQKKNNDTLDKDAFLKLLVAEMQYQDPLEPTSNTEWVAQMASFSGVEEMQNVETLVNNMQASSLVGKYVILNTTADGGTSSYVSGVVDYVYYEEGEAFLSVNDKLYSIKDLDTVANEDYVDAVASADTLMNAIKKLPTKNNLTLDDEDSILKVRELLDSMNAYQKQFVDKDAVTRFEELENRLKELHALYDV